ncbi:hypothetical protein LTR84_010085 [Exophiala bonariae]|uniref:Uncharacterized protein n=1 Tax=Exophiala bonariae TaxID=1690606 RepID=A0AAV9NKA1_9EURO|nr:hypothetical protein LTR84_010085 [Exophiala bonariae]
MAPKLESAFTMRAYLSKESVKLDGIKSGPSRLVLPITHGFVQGSGLTAKVLPGGADWLLLDPSTNVAHLDVRTQARTADGHSLYIHYHGVLKVDDAGSKALAGAADAKSTDFGDHEWFAGPVIETDDPNFKWVETTLFVGQGRYVIDDEGSAVEYQIYKVVN